LQDKMDVLVFVDKWVGGGGGILRKKAKWKYFLSNAPLPHPTIIAERALLLDGL
jgi:hypothetical protein